MKVDCAFFHCMCYTSQLTASSDICNPFQVRLCLPNGFWQLQFALNLFACRSDPLEFTALLTTQSISSSNWFAHCSICTTPCGEEKESNLIGQLVLGALPPRISSFFAKSWAELSQASLTVASNEHSPITRLLLGFNFVHAKRNLD